jgi:bifunctional lysine-specific demethylase and histidyl-hydroxylase NO66
LTINWKVRRVPHPDAPDLADLVGDDVTFRREVMFRAPLMSRVAEVAKFGDVEVLWDDLLRRGTRQPAFRVVRDGRTAAGPDVSRRAGIGNRDLDDLIAANAVIARYRGGDTVVLQGLHHTSPHLAKLANNIALALDHPVQINAYLSPPAAQALDLHFDFHDVFVVQLEGSKRWRVWSPLPRTAAPVKGRHHIAAPRLDELGDPLLDRTMSTGDCLYMPRGHPHAAETVDEHSSHLTIGVVAVTWQRVLRNAIDAEVAAGRLTGALPIGLLDPATPAPSEFGDMATVPPLTPDVLRHWMAREVWRRQPSTRLRPRLVPALSTRRLAFVPGPLLWLTVVGDRAVLGLGERLLDMPLEAHTFLSNLLDAEAPLDIDRLEGLDDESRAVVLTRLLAEGVLVHVD